MAMGQGPGSVPGGSAGAREGAAGAGVIRAPPSVAGTAVSLQQQQQQHIVAPTAAAATAATSGAAVPLAGASAGAGSVPGVYSAAERRAKIERYLAKRRRRVWRRNIKYSCRKKLADDRPRFKGRFVKTGAEAESSAAAVVDGEGGGVGNVVAGVQMPMDKGGAYGTTMDVSVNVPVSVSEPVSQMTGALADNAAMGLNSMAGGMVGMGGGMGADMDFGMY